MTLRPRRIGRRTAVAVTGGAIGVVAMSGTALAYWTATDSTSGAQAVADTLPQGSTPTATVAGNTVSLTFPQKTTSASSGSTPLTSYTIKRYSAASGGSAVATLQCTSTASPANCTDSTAGNGTWYYTDAPQVSLWQGAESARSTGISTTPLSVSTTSLPAGAVNEAYSAQLAASGGNGSYTWTLTGGTLPAGLTLNSSTGVISGTPTTAGTSNGLVFKATDTGGATASTSSLTINVAAALTVTTTSLPAGRVSQSYSTQLAASGGTGSYTWTLTGGRLPAGLTLNSSTGVISGTPTTAGTSNGLVFTATDTGGATASTSQLSLTINSAVSVTTTSLPAGTVGTAYSTQLAASGGTGSYTWTLTGGTLPAGLTLNSSTGVISGTPTTAGTSNGLVFKATDTGGATASTSQLSLTINSAVLVTTTSLPAGTVGTAYSTQLAASGGTGSYTWTLTGGTLPAGLTLNSSTGVISGTPTTAGTSNGLVFKATDTGGATASTSQLSLTINSAVSVTTTSLPDGRVHGNGNSYSAQLTASGGTGSYTWTLTGGTLPAGLTLNSSTGVISGTPTTAGTSNGLVFTATDTGGATASTTSLSIKIGN